MTIIGAAWLLPRRVTTPTTVEAQNVTPAGLISDLSIDNGQAVCALGPELANPVTPGFGWVNKLTPTTYPATIRSITIGFNRANQLVNPDLLFRIIVLVDPEGDGPANAQQPDATFIGRVRGGETFMTFNLVSPLRITQGSFVVGAIDTEGNADFPALFDSGGTSSPPGSESFFSLDAGATWRSLRDGLAQPGLCAPGSFLIRASVETDPADTLSVKNTIKDPLAVDPWSVDFTFDGGQGIVANLGSDNVTTIKGTDGSFNNLPVGDGPGGQPDGPFGTAMRIDGARAYVTLFGANEPPADPDQIDFAALSPGRVAVLTRQSENTFSQTAQISVGQGPMFPSLARNASKLYVPCAGSNRVDVIDTATNQKVREIPVGATPSSCALSINGLKLYVTNSGSNTISVINVLTDQVIKVINLALGGQPLTHPWFARVSPANGNLYVTLRNLDGTGENVSDIGLVVIDPCRDEIIRTFVDDATKGAPFGIDPGILGSVMLFTNEAPKIVGAIDPRIDQVVSAPPLSTDSAPRGVVCTLDPTVSQPQKQIGYVALGQPENSVLVLNVPVLPENIADIPLIQSIKQGSSLKISGRGFKFVDRVEVFTSDSPDCLTFNKRPKFKKDGLLIVQKGKLSNGRTFNDIEESLSAIRVVVSDGTSRLFSFSGAVPQPAP
jgi:YVTN family beta-propeller protein